MLSSATSRTSQLRSRPAARIPTVCVVDPQACDYQAWNSLGEAGELQLQMFTSAVEALRFARRDMVDLWVVNAELPGIAGCELCRMLREQSTASHVYLVSDDYSCDLEREAYAAHAIAYGAKPSHDDWLGQWLTHVRSREGTAVNASPKLPRH